MMSRYLVAGFICFFLFGCQADRDEGFEEAGQFSFYSYHGQIHPLSLAGSGETVTRENTLPEERTSFRIESFERRPGTVCRDTSAGLLRLMHLLNNGADLNEPVTQRAIGGTLTMGPYFSCITVSSEKYLHIQFDNDIFNNTDRFYTNGLRFDFISPVFQRNPLSRLMIPYWYPGINYYGISLVQHMYTPSTTKIGGILTGDRPYASYLYFSSFKITNDALHKFRQTSELQVGIIGPSSLGEAVQKSFHKTVPSNHEPLGWEFQVQDDLLLNYAVTVEKGIFSWPWCEINLGATGMLGTVYTQTQGNIYLRAGSFNPYFQQLFLSKQSLNRKRSLKNIQYYFFLDISGRLVGYDATLQGGIFNRTSPYIISSSNISRLVFEGSAGIIFSYGGFQLSVTQFLLSPEFRKGWWHKWLSIGITCSF